MHNLSKIYFNKKEFFFLIGVFVFSLFLRFIYLTQYKNIETFYPVSSVSDSYYYFKWAERISKGDLLADKFILGSPLYAYFLISLLKIFDFNLIYIYFFQFLIGSFSCLLLYFICKKLFNEIVGLIAVLFYLLYGLFIFYEGMLLPISLSIFLNLILFFWLILLREKQPNKKEWFLLGIYLGICGVISSYIILFGILAGMFILLEKKLKFINRFSLMIVGFMLIVGLFSLRNCLVSKDKTLISPSIGFDFYLGNNPKNPSGLFYYPFYTCPNKKMIFRDMGALARMNLNKNLKLSKISHFWIKKTLDFIREEPFSYLRIFLNKFIYLLFVPYEHLTQDWQFLPIKDTVFLFNFLFKDLKFMIGFFYLGIILGLKRLKENYLLYLAIFSIAFSIALFFVSSQQRILLVLFLVIFSAFGFGEWIGILFQKRYLRFAFFSIIIFIVFLKFSLYQPKDDFKKSYFLLSFNKAFDYKDKFNYQSGLKEIKKALKLEPENPLALNLLADLYYKLNNSKRAEIIFKKIIQKYPFFVDAYYNLGLIYNEHKLFKQAQVVLKKAVIMEPDNYYLSFELARSYKGLGNFEEAKKALLIALDKVDPRNIIEIKRIEDEFLGLIGK